MCLISVCPKGTVKYSPKVEAFIRSGAKSNPSGSGFMYKKNGENLVTISKGYFNVEDLLTDIKFLELKEEDELVIHHRIPTSGGKNAENTHPFVCADEHELVCATRIVTDKPCMVHNGVFWVRNYEDLNPHMSDTYAFARYIMGNKNIMNLFYEDSELFKFMLKDVLNGQKVAFLFPDKDLEMIGNFILEDGYYHSNMGYNRHVTNVGGVEYKNSINDSNIESEDFALSNYFKILNKEAEAKRKVFTKAIYLSEAYIEITENNYRDFRYIRKEDAFKGNEQNVTLFEIENFDSEALLQTIVDRNDTYSRYSTIATEKLLTGCYYVPKGEINYSIYKDYKDLVDLSLQPNKTMIKKLQKTLERNYKHSNTHLILYKKVGRKYCKKALELHLQDLIISLGGINKKPEELETCALH